MTCDFLLLEFLLQNLGKLRVELGFYLFRGADGGDECDDGDGDDDGAYDAHRPTRRFYKGRGYHHRPRRAAGHRVGDDDGDDDPPSGRLSWRHHRLLLHLSRGV